MEAFDTVCKQKQQQQQVELGHHAGQTVHTYTKLDHPPILQYTVVDFILLS